MAGRKYGVVIYAKTPANFATLSAAEKVKPGKAFDEVLKKYRGKIDLVRRYWTSTFTHESSDVFVMECDDPSVMHAFNEDLDRAMARAGGDPSRYGSTVHVTFGINPDADAPKRGGR
jgi:alkanesulfonate monooxygenase SsuD/methylene tetrahydromethanopterin reductase-like flavin-dependent oxidoreductase (luciferase family)